MGFFSSAWKSITGSDDRRRAREQADAQARLLEQQMQNQRDQLAFQKRSTDEGLLLEKSKKAKERSALAAAQAMSLRSKGISEDDDRRSALTGGGTNAGGIIG